MIPVVKYTMLWFFWAHLASAYIALDVSMRHDLQQENDKRHVDADLISRYYYHVVTMEVGSNKEKVDVIVDTNAGDLWFPSPSCSVVDLELRLESAKRGGPKPSTEGMYWLYPKCHAFGTFNYNQSSSFISNGTRFNADYSQVGYDANGIWGSDVVSIGGQSLTVDFGVATYASTVGILGLGNVKLESRNSYQYGYVEYDNFPVQLRRQGITEVASYAFSIPRDNSTLGELLFGAINKAKYDGTLYYVHMVNDGGGAYEQIILDGVVVGNYGIRHQTAVVLAHGNPFLALPSEILTVLYKYLGIEYDYSQDPVDCKYLQLEEQATLYFSGISLQVPMSDLIYKFKDECFLGATEGSWDFYQLGDNILKNFYVVYMMDSLEVALAQASTDNKSDDIEEITNAIPGAKKAPNYDDVALIVSWTTNTYGWMEQSTYDYYVEPITATLANGKTTTMSQEYENYYASDYSKYLVASVLYNESYLGYSSLMSLLGRTQSGQTKSNQTLTLARMSLERESETKSENSTKSEDSTKSENPTEGVADVSGTSLTNALSTGTLKTSSSNSLGRSSLPDSSSTLNGGMGLAHFGSVFSVFGVLLLSLF